MQPFIESVPAGLAAVFPSLADAGLKGVVLLGAIGLTMLPLRRASADTRHLAWFCGIIGLLVLPIFSILLPDWRALPAWAAWPRSHPTATSTVWPRPLALSTAVADRNSPAAPLPAPAPLMPAAPALPALSKPAGEPMHTGSWLVLAWIAGAALCATRLLIGRWRLHLVGRRALLVTSGPLLDALRSAGATLQARRGIELLLDPDRTIPLAWGVWHPRMVLPAEAATWEPERRQAVLLHELAHVKRGDLLVLLLTQVACVIHWFNPLVWIAAWRLHIERERACDDLVLAAGVKASAYAEHLLHVATQLEACAPIGSLAMARPSRLEGRLLAVLNAEINRCSPTTRVAALFLVSLTVFLIPLAMLRGADEKSREEAVEPREPDREALAPKRSSAPEPTPRLPAAGNEALPRRKEAGKKQIADGPAIEIGVPANPRTTPSSEAVAENRPQEDRARQIELLNREIEIANEQVKRASKGYEEGQTPIDRVVQQQRELSLLKIEQAKLQHNLAGLETAIREEIDLVEKFRRMQEKRVEEGVETRDSILTLQRELLRLERELAAASSARDASSYSVQDEKRKLEQSHQSDESQKIQSNIESMLSRGLGQSHPAVKAMRDRLQQLTVSAKPNAESDARSERRRELAISAPKPGIVQQVVVREGAKVKAGERLLVFDDRQAKVKLQTARAQLDAAKAVLKLEEIALQGASAELERAKEITAARLAPQTELASKQRAYESAQASLAKSNAEAAVVEQQLRQAEIELEMLTILSPKNGTILRVNILEGEHTSPANDPLIVIGD